MRILLPLLLLAACDAEGEGSLLAADQVAPAGAMELTVSAVVPGDVVSLSVSGAVPGSSVYFMGDTTRGQGPCIRNICLGIPNPRVLGIRPANRRGVAQMSLTAPSSLVPGSLTVFQAASIDGTPASTSDLVAQIVGSASCPTVDPSNSYYGRFEGLGLDNSCRSDLDCVVGGCSGEVCAAESAFTTCEFIPNGPTGSCGCVNNVCVWNDPAACP